MNEQIRLAIFTSIRSEYGLLKPIIRSAFSDERFKPELLVGGAHLSEQHGYTLDEIVTDGFAVSAKLPFFAESHIPSWHTESLGNLQRQIGVWMLENTPHYVMILGDRFELLSVATAALLSSVPIAHISGGETTEGAIDNQVRHALSKMSHLHFPATELYKRNLCQMGEESWRICVCGEPGLDDIANMKFIEREPLLSELGVDPTLPVICATFHPETIDNSITVSFLSLLFELMLRHTNYSFVVTSSNFDVGGEAINQFFHSLSRKEQRIRFFSSLGKTRYYSLMKISDAMIGNSSSGIVEAQSFNLPVVNIGKRQLGRLSNPCVRHVGAEPEAVLIALGKALEKTDCPDYFNKPNIYGSGNASEKILEFLVSARSRNLIQKRDVFG